MVLVSNPCNTLLCSCLQELAWSSVVSTHNQNPSRYEVTEHADVSSPTRSLSLVADHVGRDGRFSRGHPLRRREPIRQGKQFVMNGAACMPWMSSKSMLGLPKSRGAYRIANPRHQAMMSVESGCPASAQSEFRKVSWQYAAGASVGQDASHRDRFPCILRGMHDVVLRQSSRVSAGISKASLLLRFPVLLDRAQHTISHLIGISSTSFAASRAVMAHEVSRSLTISFANGAQDDPREVRRYMPRLWMAPD